MKPQTAEKEPVYRVLVVDDDRMIRNLISTVLSTKGHLTEEASGGKEALGKVGPGEYDGAVVFRVSLSGPFFHSLNPIKVFSPNYRNRD